MQWRRSLKCETPRGRRRSVALSRQSRKCLSFSLQVRRRARSNVRDFVFVTRNEKIVVVKNEDVDAARFLELRSFSSATSPTSRKDNVCRASSALATRRCNRTCSSHRSRGSKRAARCRDRNTPPDRHGDRVAEFGEIGQLRMLGASRPRPVHCDTRGPRSHRAANDFRSPRERDHRLFGFLTNDRIDLGEVRQNFVRRERSEMSAHRDVTAITRITKRHRVRQKIATSPLKRERDSDESGAFPLELPMKSPRRNRRRD